MGKPNSRTPFIIVSATPKHFLKEIGSTMNLSESEALTAEEKKLVDEIVDKMRGDMGDAAQRFGARVVRHGTKILRGRRVRNEGFQGRLYARWGYPLDLYELCLYIAQNCGDYFNREFRPKAAATNDYQFESLVRLQAGAARVAILAGPSNADLADPGQGAVLSLTHATAALIKYEPVSRDIAYLEQRVALAAMVSALSVLADMASREFVKVHHEREEEIRVEKEKGTPPNLSGRAPRPARQ
jgi:hypothetical protein